MLTTYVKVKSGSVLGEQIKEKSFKLVKGPLTDKHYNIFFLVKGEELGKPGRNVRVNVDSEHSYELLKKEDTIENTPTKKINQIEKIKSTDSIELKPTNNKKSSNISQKVADLKIMVDSISGGKCRSLILECNGSKNLITEICSILTDKSYKIYNGTYKPESLTTFITENQNSVLIFDDTNKCMRQEVSLGILSKIVSSKKNQTITLQPNKTKVNFDGGVIFLTQKNIPHALERLKSSKKEVDKKIEYIEQLLKKSFYSKFLFTDINEQVKLIKEYFNENDFFVQIGFDDEIKEEIFGYVFQKNEDDISVENIKKVAELRKINENEWMRLADYYVFRDI